MSRLRSGLASERPSGLPRWMIFRSGQSTGGIPATGAAMAGIGALEREPVVRPESVAEPVPKPAAGAMPKAVPEPEPARAQALLDARERFAFEHGMQRLRLTFLASPILVCATFGWAALPFAVQITAVTLGSYAVIALALRRAPGATLRWQLALRVMDCLL